MAEVTVYDATRMKAIEDATVVNGEIDPVTGHLMLARFDESVIDAGLVNVSPRVVTSGTRPVTGLFEGLVIYETDTDRFYTYSGTAWIPQGNGVFICTSATRPANPFAGMRIYETNTDLNYMYVSGAWRREPWKAAWGVLAVQRLTASTSPTNLGGNTDMVLAGVTVRNDRNYKVHLNSGVALGAAGGIWTVDLSVDAVLFDRFYIISETYLYGDTFSADILVQPSTTAAVTFRVVLTEISGTVTCQLAANATAARAFWIEDIGPRVP